MSPNPYPYRLANLAPQCGNPLEAIFPNRSQSLYRPTITVMEAYDADNSSPLPAHATLTAAKENAAKILDRKVAYPLEAEEQTYSGLDHEDIPRSRDLCAEAEEGHSDVATYFDDFLTAEFYRGALRPNKRMVDHSIPTNVGAMKLHVSLLVRAFKSTLRCDDNGGMIKPFLERRHDSKLVECLCWNIVKACIFRSKSDEPLLTAYEPYKARNSTGLDSFEKRFDAVATAMCRSKTICKHLFDAPYINTFVDDPLRSIRRVDANRDLNRQKAGIMAQGKALQQGGGGGGPPTGGSNGQKKTRNSRKRSASNDIVETRNTRARLQTPPSAAQSAMRYGTSTPGTINSRTTHRSDCLVSDTEGSPYASPPSSRGNQIPSPRSSEEEVKNEASPAQRQQGYIMNAQAGFPAPTAQHYDYENGVLHTLPHHHAYFPQVPRNFQFSGAAVRGHHAHSVASYMPSSIVPATSMWRRGPM
jgi:hypothetical protein